MLRRLFVMILLDVGARVWGLHEQELGVEPQLFLLRWLRLLFEREFHLEDVLVVWDSLFVVFFRL